MADDHESIGEPVRLHGDARLRAVAPFAAVSVAGMSTLLLPPFNDRPHNVPMLLLCVVLTMVALAWMSVLPEKHALLIVPTIGLFAVLATARDLGGGATSGLAPLMILPVLWVVLHGTRMQLWVSGACTTLVFIAPVLLIGAPDYAVSDWRRGVLSSLVVVVVCPVLQQGVERLRASAQHEKDHAGALNSVLAAATEHSIIVTDLAGTITMFSEGAERMLRYRAIDVVGKLALAHLHDPDEVASRAGELGIEPGFRVLVDDSSAGVVGGSRWTYRRRGGSTLRVQLTLSRLLDDDGMHTGWIAIAQDVTSEELTQHELAAAEKRWRVLLDHLPDTAVLVVGPELEFRIAVGAGLARQGLDGVQGRTLFETSTPANVAILEPMFRAALAGESSSGETRSSHPHTVNEVVVVPLPEHEGDAEALVVARDVTVHRQREADLRMARDRFERLFEEAPHGTMLLDGGGLVTRVNPAFSTMVGTAATEIVDRPVLSLPFMAGLEPSRLGEFTEGSLSRLSVDRTLRAGARDELHVTVTAVALRGEDETLQGLLVTVIDVSERTRYEAQLAHLADHDPLTGLANRRRFDAELASHLERCRRDGVRGALLMLDLDHFKQINDTLGHGAGDHLIVSVAAVLRARMRAADVVARLGGDEFAVLLPSADRQDAETVAGDLVDLVRDQVSVLEGTMARTITTSIGVVVIDDAHITALDLIRTADLTMYDAKHAGRNRYAVHQSADFALSAELTAGERRRR